jgi:hypothetical protein
VWSIVGVLAISSAAVVVAVAYATRGPEPHSAVQTKPAGRGVPPLVLDLGVRDDPEARRLREGARLFDRGRRREAARIFAGSASLNAQIGAAFAAWPKGTLERVHALERAHPQSALVHLHVGLVLVAGDHVAAAKSEWRTAARVEPDSPSAVRAGDLLHPRMARGLPQFVPSFGAPAGLAKLPPARQLDTLARQARRPDVRAKLLYGVAFQRIERPRSAERQFQAAASLAPADAEAQVAAAVGLFDKDNPSLAFSHLGPLTQRFPHAPTVRFHLGLLLLWLGQLSEARHQLTLARAEGPSTPLGREANRFLLRLSS